MDSPFSILSRRLRMVANHIARSGARSVSTLTLESAPKTSSFSQRLQPDPAVPNVDVAKDPATESPLMHKARILKGGAFTWVRPEARKEYVFLSASPAAIRDLGLDPEKEIPSEYFRQVVSGQKVVEDPFPYSQAYAGYQFGQFAGQLGDGRVVNLFEITNPETGKRYELQLKGSGLTPFSRFADGKAVLRSSIREFIISEALNGIGIPSTRAVAITSLPKTYARRSIHEKCAVVCRMAPSWIRVGTFDLCSYRGDRDGVYQLADYVIDEVFKGELSEEEYGADAKIEALGELTKYDKLYFEIVCRNAKAVAYWQAYGFLNGVLNTDNTSILGLAIDFGPFAFMDYWDPDFTSNHDDSTKRYSFKNMPSAIWFNMLKLGEDMAETLGAGPELLKDQVFLENGLKEEQVDAATKRARSVIEAAGDIYEKMYVDTYLRFVGRRLGTTPKRTDHHGILRTLFETLRVTKLDYNQFFVTLQSQPFADDSKFDVDKVAEAFIPANFEDDPFSEYTRENVKTQLKTFVSAFKARVSEEDEPLSDAERFQRASKYNPLFVPYNWVLEEVIEFTQENEGNPEYLDKLLKMASNPYDRTQWGSELKDLEKKWTAPAKKDLQMTQCSCSS